MLADPAPDVPGVRVSDKLADPAPEVFSQHPRFLRRKNEWPDHSESSRKTGTAQSFPCVNDQLLCLARNISL